MEELLFQERKEIALRPEKLTHSNLFHETEPRVQVTVADTEPVVLHSPWQILSTPPDHGFCQEDHDAAKGRVPGGAIICSTSWKEDGHSTSLRQVEPIRHHVLSSSMSCTHGFDSQLLRGAQGGEGEAGLRG
eukprot:5475159-Karenia_brevis.AAC.1